MNHASQRTRLAAIGACLATLPLAALADGGRVEEVIVTAQKHEENIQEIPLAISAMTGAELEKKGITSYEGIAKSTPSISFRPFPNSSNTLILYMRGQGEGNPSSITSNGSVGLYQDGFYLARAQSSTFDLADLDHIEVLRGPQGTLYGRNTTGGAINLISRQPTGEFGFRQTLSFGSRNLLRSLTTVNLPRWGGIATKLTLLKSSIDGYVKNAGSSHDYGEERQRAGRFQLHWDVSDAFAVDYFMEKGNLDSTPTYFVNPSLAGRTYTVGGVAYRYPQADNPPRRTYRPVDLKLSTSDFEGHGLTLSWDVNEQLTIKSLTGYRTLDADAYQDFAESFGIFSTSEEPFGAHQFSQEFQFIGHALDDRINYVGGLYYFKEGGSHATVSLQGTNLTNTAVTADAESQAAFGQITWTPDVLDGNLGLTLGARYTRDKRSAQRMRAVNGAVLENGAATGAANDQRFSRFNPSFTVNYQWTSDVSTYAKVSTGYRAGGSYEQGPPGKFNQTFAPEDITSYELGLKSYWFDQRVRLNIAAFASKLKDMQLVFPADPANRAVTQVYNAGRSSIKGVEVGLMVVPAEDLTLNLDYTYLHPVVDRVDVIPNTVLDQAGNPASPYHVGDNIKDLFVMPFAPRHSLNLGGDYTLFRFNGGDLSAHLDYRWQDQVYENPAGGPAVPGRSHLLLAARGVLDARLSAAFELPHGDRARISLWGKNIGNKQYHQSEIALGGVAVPFQQNPTTVVAAGYTNGAIAWSEPPSYGVDLTYEY